MDDIGSLIRKHRLERGWRQDELAAKLGTHQGQISQWETGRDPLVIQFFFDKLVMIFDYPEDMLTCGWSSS